MQTDKQQLIFHNPNSLLLTSSRQRAHVLPVQVEPGSGRRRLVRGQQGGGAAQVPAEGRQEGRGDGRLLAGQDTADEGQISQQQEQKLGHDSVD